MILGSRLELVTPSQKFMFAMQRASVVAQLRLFLAPGVLPLDMFLQRPRNNLPQSK